MTESAPTASGTDRESAPLAAARNAKWIGIIIAGGLLAVLWGALGYLFWAERAHALAQARSNAANLSRAFAEHVGST
ncbi:MAG TPA: hypothetical protein VIM38_03035, partial [Alphaproteobacteria bacterium]